ncbi:DUF2062 domain-containing protein [Litorivita pollutaquae]|uniref:DUF2062 domain-containing protein n=1 Tax=Litorivita pollutaquae TaxID=2200892 RepID=A0A2V4NVD0_9RHOB|nr:DUF2062 domain-containing protein [Litorivita pollutaquae]OUS20559.1 DNA-directed RNA polymerase subunit omega [Rhodobacterales bacterium 59_46_T64]PYC49016.1 DUF2062 domain-containing protein [Litorivita pollutaquae]
MVFKRRDRRPIWKIAVEFFYPRGGWYRAALYIRHRLRRLPDPPHRIARGILAGIFTTFTPFYGVHFVIASLIAFVLRGNILAALLATFFGNPLTYVPIGVASMKTGYFLLGMDPQANDMHRSLGGKFLDAASDLQSNFFAMFTDAVPDWTGLSIFYHEVFFPYLVGGVIIGVIAGIIGYYVSLPLIQAYQNRRLGALKAKLASIKQKAAAKADARKKAD